MGTSGDDSRHIARQRLARRTLTVGVAVVALAGLSAGPVTAAEGSAPAATTATTAPASGAPTSSAPTAAAEPTSDPTIELADPSQTEVYRTASVRGTVASAASGTVVVERLDGSTWREVGRPAITADGAFAQPFVTPPGRTSLRARLLVDGQEVAADQTTLTGVPARVTASLKFPAAAKDYSTITAAIKIKRVHDGAALARSGVVQLRIRGHRSWSTVAHWRSSKGVATTRLRPHHDGAYRLVVPATSLSTALTGAAKGFDLRAPGRAVVLPKGAPRPTVRVPAQARPDRPGADVRIEGVGPTTWKSMVGRSWHSGCPVGRSSLRVIRTSYWAYDGYIRRGELVVHASAARDVAGIFADLYRAKVPIRSIYRVDRFGYHAGLQGANDYKSMDAGNTSAFNCRRVVGSPQLISPHTYGTAIDINTWENPYRSARGYEPNSWWASRSRPANITWRGANDPVVRIFNRHGFRWLGAADLHHFER